MLSILIKLRKALCKVSQEIRTAIMRTSANQQLTSLEETSRRVLQQGIQYVYLVGRNTPSKASCCSIENLRSTEYREDLLQGSGKSLLYPLLQSKSFIDVFPPDSNVEVPDPEAGVALDDLTDLYSKFVNHKGAIESFKKMFKLLKELAETTSVSITLCVLTASRTLIR
jgi:hypothetical protein